MAAAATQLAEFGGFHKQHMADDKCHAASMQSMTQSKPSIACLFAAPSNTGGFSPPPIFGGSSGSLTSICSGHSSTQSESGPARQSPGYEPYGSGVPVLTSVLLKRAKLSAPPQYTTQAQDAVDTILNNEQDVAAQVNAANILANLASRPEVQTYMGDAQFLSLLLQAYRDVADECVRRFLLMAIARASANATCAKAFLDSDEMLELLCDSALHCTNGNWRQAARALALITTNSSGISMHSQIVVNVIEAMKRMMTLSQSEFPVDAMRAFAVWSKSKEGVELLSLHGVWTAALNACMNVKSTTVNYVCANLVLDAAKLHPQGLRFGLDGLRALCALSLPGDGSAINSNARSQAMFSEALCKLVVEGEQGSTIQKMYLAAGAATSLQKVANGEESKDVHLALALLGQEVDSGSDEAL